MIKERKKGNIEWWEKEQSERTKEGHGNCLKLSYMKREKAKVKEKGECGQLIIEGRDKEMKMLESKQSAGVTRRVWQTLCFLKEDIILVILVFWLFVLLFVGCEYNLSGSIT